MKVRVVGVRHHSPACARLVRQTILRERPHTVLLEGPADFNHRIEELLLGHDTPLAIFSYFQEESQHRRSFSPFCSYSPEWVALQTAHEIGSRCLFMDLPAWTRPFRKVENRYRDGDRSREYVARLCHRLGLNGMDELWDHLFEGPLAEPELGRRLNEYFENLRECSVVEDSDLEREEFMGRFLSWAARDGSVLAVCGGFHKSALEENWSRFQGEQPAIPEPSSGGRCGSFLVPYSYYRLDSFTGYAAGMPCPQFYEWLWVHGAEGAYREAFSAVMQRLRERKVSLSSADLIACESMARGLQRLRNHRVPTRTDLLDGVTASLIKNGLDHRLPWLDRGKLDPGTDPIIVEMLSTLSGDREGRLAAETPLPPLVESASRELREHDLWPERTERTVEVEVGSERSHILHRLQLIGVPGFQCRSEELGQEAWSISRSQDFESAVTEAGAFGPTLEEAALARVKESVQHSTGFSVELAGLLTRIYRAGLSDLTSQIQELLAERVTQETSLESLGAAASRVLTLWRSFQASALKALLEQSCRRSLWLLELVSGPQEGAKPSELKALVVLRDCYRSLDFEAQPLLDLMKRRAEDPSAPPAYRGAALGFQWVFQPSDSLLPWSVERVQHSSHPARLGDFLAGLFAVARERVVGTRDLTRAIDEVVAGYTEHDFLVALPALRLAFSYFPPRERESIAATLLREQGVAEGQAWTLLRDPGDPTLIAQHRALESSLDKFLERRGLL